MLFLILTLCEIYAFIYSLYFFGFNYFVLREGDPFPWEVMLFTVVSLVNIGFVALTIFNRLVVFLKLKK